MMSEQDWCDFYGIDPKETHEERQKRLRNREERFQRKQRIKNGTATSRDKWNNHIDEYGY